MPVTALVPISVSFVCYFSDCPISWVFPIEFVLSATLCTPPPYVTTAWLVTLARTESSIPFDQQMYQSA